MTERRFSVATMATGRRSSKVGDQYLPTLTFSRFTASLYTNRIRIASRRIVFLLNLDETNTKYRTSLQARVTSDLTTRRDGLQQHVLLSPTRLPSRVEILSINQKLRHHFFGWRDSHGRQLSRPLESIVCDHQ